MRGAAGVTAAARRGPAAGRLAARHARGGALDAQQQEEDLRCGVAVLTSRVSGTNLHKDRRALGV